MSAMHISVYLNETVVPKNPTVNVHFIDSYFKCSMFVQHEALPLQQDHTHVVNKWKTQTKLPLYISGPVGSGKMCVVRHTCQTHALVPIELDFFTFDGLDRVFHQCHIAALYLGTAPQARPIKSIVAVHLCKLQLKKLHSKLQADPVPCIIVTDQAPRGAPHHITCQLSGRSKLSSALADGTGLDRTICTRVMANCQLDYRHACEYVNFFRFEHMLQRNMHCVKDTTSEGMSTFDHRCQSTDIHYTSRLLDLECDVTCLKGMQMAGTRTAVVQMAHSLKATFHQIVQPSMSSMDTASTNVDVVKATDCKYTPAEATEALPATGLPALLLQLDQAQLLLNTIKKLAKDIHKESSKRKKRPANPNGIPRKPSGFATPVEVTDKLCILLGEEPGTKIARTEVTKRITLYIKGNNPAGKPITDPEKPKYIHLDYNMKNVFELDTSEEYCISWFDLQKHLKVCYPKKVAPAVTTEGATVVDDAGPAADDDGPAADDGADAEEQDNKKPAPKKRKVVKKEALAK